jgi:hypothetical protein
MVTMAEWFQNLWDDPYDYLHYLGLKRTRAIHAQAVIRTTHECGERLHNFISRETPAD